MNPNASPDVVGRGISAALVDILLLAVVFVLYATAFGQSRATRRHAAVAVHGILSRSCWPGRRWAIDC